MREDSGVVRRIVHLKGGYGRNGAGELWRLFAPGQVRSAAADVCRNGGGSGQPGERV